MSLHPSALYIMRGHTSRTRREEASLRVWRRKNKWRNEGIPVSVSARPRARD